MLTMKQACKTLRTPLEVLIIASMSSVEKILCPVSSDSEFEVDTDDEFDSDEEIVEYTLAGDDSDEDYESDTAGRVMTRYLQAFRGGDFGHQKKRYLMASASSHENVIWCTLALVVACCSTAWHVPP